jgi:putative ABC transport system permease protein
VLRLVVNSIRSRPAGFAASMVALALAIALIAACGILIDSTTRTGPQAHLYGAAPIVVQPDAGLMLLGTHEETLETDIPDASVRLPRSLVGQITGIDGVEQAVAEVTFYAQAAGSDGTALTGPDGGATQGHSWESASLTPFELRDGRAPSGPNEIAIDADLARRGRLGIGDHVSVLTAQEAPRLYRVAGVVGLPDADGLPGQSAIFFAPDVAQRLADADGQVDAIGIWRASGVTPNDLAGRIEEALAQEHVEVLTGGDRADADPLARNQALDDAGAALGTMGGIAGFVSIFVVGNTFAYSILQRTREIGLLRAVGATPRQLSQMIVGEAVAVAIVSAGFGIVGGIGLAQALVPLLVRTGIAPDDFRAVVGPIPLLIAAGSGLGVALIAVFSAARQASRIHPIEALREAAVQPRAMAKRRWLLGILLTIGGFVLLGASQSTGSEDGPPFAFLVGMVFMIAAGVLGPALARPLGWVVGRPLARLSPASGFLAQAGARANVRRVASAASPLMLTIAFGAMMLVITATQSRWTIDQANTIVVADGIVDANGADGLPPAIVDELRAVPGVATVSPTTESAVVVRTRGLEGGLFDRPVLGVDPASLSQTLDFTVEVGSLTALNGGTIAVSDLFAEQNDWEVGEELSVKMADGSPQTLRVVAVFERNAALPDLLIPRSLAEQHTPSSLVDTIYLRYEPGAVREEVEAGIADVAKRYPTLEVLSRAEYLDGVAEAAKSGTWALYLIVGLALAYSAIANVNTMVMATADRAREFAALRLLGGTQRQVVRMVTFEAAIIVLMGTIVGLAIAGVSAVAFARAISASAQIAAPWLQVAGLVVGAGALGFAASIVPARLAVRVDPIQAAATRE